MTRQFGPHKFTCNHPGEWISSCGKYGVYHMMAGTSQAQWEVYKADEGQEDPLDGDMIAYHFTMTEAVVEAFNLSWNDLRRKRGIGSNK